MAKKPKTHATTGLPEANSQKFTACRLGERLVC
jgi:hypothetical protein